MKSLRCHYYVNFFLKDSLITERVSIMHNFDDVSWSILLMWRLFMIWLMIWPITDNNDSRVDCTNRKLLWSEWVLAKLLWYDWCGESICVVWGYYYIKCRGSQYHHNITAARESLDQGSLNQVSGDKTNGSLESLQLGVLVVKLMFRSNTNKKLLNILTICSLLL